MLVAAFVDRGVLLANKAGVARCVVNPTHKKQGVAYRIGAIKAVRSVSKRLFCPKGSYPVDAKCV